MAKRRPLIGPIEREWFALQIEIGKTGESFLAFGSHGGPALFDTIKRAREFARELVENRGPTWKLVLVKCTVTTD